MSSQGRNTVVPGKETVVRRPSASWSFHLPDRHEIEIDREHALVSLATPQEGTTYHLAGVEESDEEVVVLLGDEIARSGPPGGAGEGEPLPEVRGYPLPEIQHERQRLLARWRRADLSEQDFQAYAQGSSHEEHFARIRKRLRDVGASVGRAS